MEEKVSIEMMKKSDKPVYKDFFLKSDIVKQWIENGDIHQSIRNNSPSPNSFCLKSKDTYRKEIPEVLIERFGIEDKDLFRAKYIQAISGDGQEWTRITTLHSSSLAALLCFYNVTSNHVLKIDKYTFTESFFEVKTHVFGESESNMDVVLRGCDENGMNVVLFLECKFSEYLESSKCYNISLAYKEYYDKLGLFEENAIDNISFKEKNGKISISPKDPRHAPVYCGGIKQMISHYIGVSKYAKNMENLGEHVAFKGNKNEKVILGEILFDFGMHIKSSKNKLKNYRQSYYKLATKINEEEQSTLFQMRPTIFTYQDIFNGDFIKEDNIRRFYQFFSKKHTCNIDTEN